MDARVKPAHDGYYAATRHFNLFIQALISVF
jgi:hypothetical protein